MKSGKELGCKLHLMTIKLYNKIKTEKGIMKK